MFDSTDLDDDLLWRTQHELAGLACAVVEADDPNLRAPDARRALNGREFRTLSDVVDALHAAGDPVDFRPLGPTPVDMQQIKGKMEEFLRLGLYGVARVLASRALAREPPDVHYRRDHEGSSLGEFTPDPVLVIEVEKAQIIAQLSELAERGDRLWELLEITPRNEGRMAFRSSILKSVEQVRSLIVLPGDAPEFAATALYGTERALSIVGAQGKEFIGTAHLLAAIVLELGGLTERRVGPTEDVDGARIEAVRRAVYRYEHRDHDARQPGDTHLVS